MNDRGISNKLNPPVNKRSRFGEENVKKHPKHQFLEITTNN